MKVIAVLAVFSVMITYTLAIQCLPGYCDKVKCDNDKVVAECKASQARADAARWGVKFEVIEKGSACACCSLCVQILKEGDGCMLLHGFDTSKRCGSGLQCSSASRECIKLH